MVRTAREFTERASTEQTILATAHLADGIEEITVRSPVIAAAASSRGAPSARESASSERSHSRSRPGNARLPSSAHQTRGG